MPFSAKTLLVLLALFMAGLMPGPVRASDRPALLMSQTLYVPAYPHVFHGVKRDIQLNTTLMIRNIDPQRAITVLKVDYYNSAGKIVFSHVKAPVRVPPLSSLRFTEAKKNPSGNETGGSSFIVTWSSEMPVNPPIVETVNIGTTSSQGISFVSPGIPIFMPKGK